MIHSCSCSTRVWIIVIGGFRQSTRDDYAQRNGCKRLHERLLNLTADDVRVLLVGWDANMRLLAQRISEGSGPNPTIIVCAFSWGVGRGARLLASHLDNSNLPVHCLIASDGVAHTTWLVSRLRALIPPRRPAMDAYSRLEEVIVRFRWLAWALGRVMPALIPTLQLPANVLSVIAFRQSRSLPMGHDFTTERMLSLRDFRRGPAHVAMDDLLEWHDECERVCLLAVDEGAK